MDNAGLVVIYHTGLSYHWRREETSWALAGKDIEGRKEYREEGGREKPPPKKQVVCGRGLDPDRLFSIFPLFYSLEDHRLLICHIVRRVVGGGVGRTGEGQPA